MPTLKYVQPSHNDHPFPFPVKMNEGDLGRLAEHLCEGLGREGRHRVGRCLVLNSRILRLQEQCWVNCIFS